MKLTKKGQKYLILEAKYSDAPALGSGGARFAWDKEGTKTGIRGAWWTCDVKKAARMVEYADNTCKGALELWLSGQNTKLELSRATTGKFDVPMPPGITLYPYQEAGVQFLFETKRALLADQMGLGKTPMTLALINKLQNSARRVLCVVPASLKINWEREANRFLTQSRRVIVVDTKTDVNTLRKAILGTARIMVVINPETLAKGSDYLVREDGEEILRGPFDQFVHSFKWDVLLVDEAHMFKNGGTKRTVALFGRERIPAKKGKRAKPAQPEVRPVAAYRVVLMSGTPYPNRPIEIQPLAGFLHEEFGNKWAFASTYCDMKQTQFGLDYSGASNLPQLQERLRSTIMIRRDKNEVLQELPPKIRQVIDLPSTGMSRLIKCEQAVVDLHAAKLQHLRAKVAASKTQGQAAWQAAVESLSDEVKLSFTEMARVRAETALAKVPRCAEYIQEALDSGALDKVGIFAHHRSVIDGMHEHFKNYGAVKLYGGMTPKAKQRSVDAFQDDPTCRVFVGSIQAAGVGLTLTAASDVYFCELDWVPGVISQAEDRFHRIGQENVVFVRHLVVDGSLDAKMAKRLVDKQVVIDAGLDNDLTLDTTDVLGYDGRSFAVDVETLEYEQAAQAGLTEDRK